MSRCSTSAVDRPYPATCKQFQERKNQLSRMLQVTMATLHTHQTRVLRLRIRNRTELRAPIDAPMLCAAQRAVARRKRVLFQFDLQQHLGRSTPVRRAAPCTGHGARIDVILFAGRQADWSHLTAERHTVVQAQQCDVVQPTTGRLVFWVRNDLCDRQVDDGLSGCVGLVEERHTTDVLGTEFDNRRTATGRW